MAPLEHATITLLSSLPTSCEPPEKIRVAGRLIGIDSLKNLAIVADGPNGIIADLSLVLGDVNSEYAPRPKDVVILTGYFCDANDGEWRLPDIATGNYIPDISFTQVLRVVMMSISEELNLNDWRLAAVAIADDN